MYKNILIPVDNSAISNYCIDMGISLARQFDSKLTGSHVYAANLHYKRFTDLEAGLPEKYKEETELQRQRDLHDVLIGKGLELISQSYLDVFKDKCVKACVQFDVKLIEGKNYLEIVKDVESSDYDLVILGVTGLGAVNGNLIGTVCERVVRRIDRDVLIIKNDMPIKGKIVTAIDGSETSLCAARMAALLGEKFEAAVELVSAFDPEYHRVAFKGISDILSEEAGKIFKFSEQEKLHEDIIDNGMAKLYKSHLDDAHKLIKDCGVKIETTLLEGKPYYTILKHIENNLPSLIIVGRTGIHDIGDLDIGGAAENLLRLAGCNILIVSGQKQNGKTSEKAAAKSGKSTNVKIHGKRKSMKNLFDSTGIPDTSSDSANLIWSDEAKARTEKIPFFVRGMVIKQIERFAKEKGSYHITPEIVDEAKKNWSDNVNVPGH